MMPSDNSYSVYGLSPERPSHVHHRNIEAEHERVKTLDEGEGGLVRIGGCNLGVFVVRNKRTGELCVQKKINGREFYSRREIHLLRHLDNPHIVRYINAFITGNARGDASLYMEYL